MLNYLYDNQVCSAARALELVGERWSLLILRDALFAGRTRFSDFQRSLGVAPNILAKRLDGFVKAGIMTTRPHGPHPHHREYELTPRGLDFKPVVIALTEWGDRWAAPEGPPIVYQHEDCGGRVGVHLRCRACGKEPKVNEVVAKPTARGRAWMKGRMRERKTK